ncbi:MAG: hypothetical protein J6Q22_17820 [Prevotella sp.]|nr:hypothetical protein [Prevotella sp.]
MKKILVMVTVAIMTAMNVNAQSGYDDTKHEIGITYGGMSTSTWGSIGETMGTILGSLGAATYDDGSFTGPISAEYFYHVSPVVGIGGIGAYAHEKKNMLVMKEEYGEATNSYITVMPAAKFNWLRSKYFGMYSKVGVGVTFRTQKEDINEAKASNNGSDQTKNDIFFNFQLSALGLEFGAETVRGFVEVGVGEQGMGLVGIRYKF